MSRALFVVVPLWLAIVDLGASGDWVTLENCRLVPNPANDGDNFHASVNGKEYIFRLYFVDAPETDAANPARLIEQAKYFGISVPQVIEMGEAAKEFTQEKLAEPFTVVTRMANAMGRSNIERFYAFVQTKEGDLGEQLVAKGLARIYGRSATPPGASSSAVERQRLKGLEDEAKRLKLGGWAANIGVSTPQIEAPHEKGNSASVAPFSPSHKIAPSATPTAVATPSTSFSVTPLPATPIPSPRKDGDAGKLDVNTATEKQLRLIPGIGPVMARRIIDARPFRSADDLKKVNGIGDKKYAEIRLYFQ